DGGRYRDDADTVNYVRGVDAGIAGRGIAADARPRLDADTEGAVRGVAAGIAGRGGAAVLRHRLDAPPRAAFAALLPKLLAVALPPPVVCDSKPLAVPVLVTVSFWLAPGAVSVKKAPALPWALLELVQVRSVGVVRCRRRNQRQGCQDDGVTSGLSHP